MTAKTPELFLQDTAEDWGLPLGCYLLGLTSEVLAVSGIPAQEGCRPAVRGWTDGQKGQDLEFREVPGIFYVSQWRFCESIT